MIKLVAFDVDGTLRDRSIIPESTREALERLKASGIQLALCTGRSEFELAPLREELGIDWAITCNGSHLGYRGRTVAGQSLSKETVCRWIRQAEQLGHTMLLNAVHQMYTNRLDDAYFRRAQREIGFMEPVPLPPVEDLPDIYQCIVFCEEQEESAYVGEEGDRFYIHRWRPWAVDFNPSGTNKAAGLQRLLRHLSISPAEVAAFGDGLNDLEMIGSVGLGIAMGNGVEALKKQARYITKPIHEDGIAFAVERWIL